MREKGSDQGMADRRKGIYTLDDDPHWYKDAIIY